MKSFAAAALALASLACAAPTTSRLDTRDTTEIDGVQYNVFNHAATGGQLQFVNNSGVCETTPGVNQYSGYFSIGNNQNMWFWFFESRNNPTTAPLVSWFNGGPGCSSMIGLFQENGPCHFPNGSTATEPVLNSNSFNEFANMIYIDQPISVGFSYGTDDVSSTFQAAAEVWKLYQAFFAAFPQYENRDFGIFTESYGGHYGPEFASYVEQQNTGIANGTVQGEKLNLIALGVNNGWYDAALQEQAYIDFAKSNSWRNLISASQASRLQSSLTSSCLPALQSCASSGSNSACSNADNACYNAVEGPITSDADFDVYDVRLGSQAVDPPETYATYLARSDIKTKIGARSTYTECPDAAYDKFSSTGDNSRSLLPELSSVVQSGIQVLMWAGDADWICNWVGNEYVANNVTFGGQSAFRAAALEPYNVNGVAGGMFKTQDNLSFLRVYAAGHEVPYYQPALALQAFRQTMSRQALAST